MMSYNTKINAESLKDFNINLPIFQTIISVKFISKDEDNYAAYTHSPVGNYIKVEFKKDWLDYATIHHESIHVATFIMAKIHLPINQDNDEFIAYVSCYVTGEIIKKIEKFAKEKTKP